MNKKTILILLICCIFCIIIAAIPLQQAIVFQPNYTNDKLAYIPVKNGDNFKIKYTHSIHLSDVIESYKVTLSQSIQQYELVYEDFSIGMPANAAAGEIFEQQDGKYYIKNMKLIFLFFICESDRSGQIIG